MSHVFALHSFVLCVCVVYVACCVRGVKGTREVLSFLQIGSRKLFLLACQVNGSNNAHPESCGIQVVSRRFVFCVSILENLRWRASVGKSHRVGPTHGCGHANDP